MKAIANIVFILILMMCSFKACAQKTKQVFTIYNTCECPARYSLREFVRDAEDGYMFPSENRLVFGVISGKTKKRVTVMVDSIYPVTYLEVFNFYQDSDDWKQHKIYTQNDCIISDEWYVQDGNDIKISCK